MKIYLLLASLYCTGRSTHHNSDIYESNNHPSGRVKLQDEKWSWGSVAAPINEPTTTTLLKNQEPNPCLNETYEPKPDYKALRKRISEIKCFEYIWEVKHRDEVNKRSTECLEYRIKHRGPFDPYFAIGGRDTLPGEFPHMGAIGWQASVGTWVFKCGSSLISSKFVLTAAHCSSASSRDTTISDPTPKIVRLGDKNILDVNISGYLTEDENIIKIIIHPNYKPPKKYFDIALMELEKDVVFTMFIQPACLWAREDSSSLGSKATVTGWGVVHSGSHEISPELQAADVDVFTNEQCDGLLRPSCNRNWCGIQETQLCAGKLAGGVDACEGDSGGPLQIKIPLPITSQGSMHYVIGVTSFGIQCALPNLPGVYTRVSSFIDWVEHIVWS